MENATNLESNSFNDIHNVVLNLFTERTNNGELQSKHIKDFKKRTNLGRATYFKYKQGIFPTSKKQLLKLCKFLYDTDDLQTLYKMLNPQLREFLIEERDEYYTDQNNAEKSLRVTKAINISKIHRDIYLMTADRTVPVKERHILYHYPKAGPAILNEYLERGIIQKIGDCYITGNNRATYNHDLILSFIQDGVERYRELESDPYEKEIAKSANALLNRKAGFLSQSVSAEGMEKLNLLVKQFCDRAAQISEENPGNIQVDFSALTVKRTK